MNTSVIESQSGVSFPYDISFPDSDSSPGARANIEEHLAKLDQYFDRITRAKVFLRIPHKHGGLRFFHIHIQVDVPGKRLVVSREPEINDSHADLNRSINDAFEKIIRQLEDYKEALKNHKEH